MDCEKVELPEAEDSLKAEGAADTDIVEQIVSEVTAILAQLTNENFDRLAGKFVNLPFEDNEERIGSVVRVLVEKAINEPSLTSTYARLIREIWLNSKEYPVIFREKIMDQCRKEFQKSSTDKTEINEIEIAIKKTNDESKKEEEIEEKRAQMERRTRGNVNFIIELYTLRSQKQKLLPACFMVEVVNMLLSSFDELNLECLCKLLTTVGHKLEGHLRGVVLSISNAEKRKRGEEIKFDPDPRWSDKTFKKLYEWSKEESLSSHVRIALLDVLELRYFNWKPRHDVNTPEIDLKKVELHKAENPWKPRRGVADNNINEQIVSQATAILIQLTHENFDSLAGKFVNLPFEDNEERIGLVVRVLVEKAIYEPSLTSTYAELIREICQNSPRDTWYKIFRVKIMDECQEEFQKSSTDKAEIKELEIASKKSNDESKKEEEIEEKRAQMERRTRGNVNFIGELYTQKYGYSRTHQHRLKLLPPSFMVEVVEMLLSSFDELNLECLCKLLTTVGLKLEQHLIGIIQVQKERKIREEDGDGEKLKKTSFTPDPEWFDKTFKKLYEWSQEESLSSHVWCAILDVLELRQTNWEPRHDVNKPGTNLEKVELHKAENPWKPRRGSQAHTNINEPIVRQPSPDSLDTLVEEFLSHPLDDKRISSVVRTFFEKSITEPTKYAKLVHTICQNSQETSNSKIFRKKILDHCQKGFQKTSTDETEIKKIEIAIEKSDDVSEKVSLKKELDEKRTQMKRQSLGNVNFMGELYKLQMLTPRIIIDCVTTMLLSMNELSLECLCKLLTSVGLKLEEEIKDIETSNKLKRNEGQEIKFAPEPNWFDKTFNKLYEFNKEASLSPRIRFALLDVFELRQNNWKPRHNANEPETIDEVCRDTIRGDVKKQSVLNWNFVPSNKSSKFQQKQSDDQHSVSGPGSQSLFKGSQKAWGSRPSPSQMPQLQMQSQIEKLPSQPNLTPRYGGNRFEA